MSTSLARRPFCNKNHLCQFTLKLLLLERHDHSPGLNISTCISLYGVTKVLYNCIVFNSLSFQFIGDIFNEAHFILVLSVRSGLIELM
jgi:hypothetical protein